MTEDSFNEPCCDICGSSKFIELIRLQEGAYNKCRTCGLIYANLKPKNYNQWNDQTYTDIMEKYIEKIRPRRKRNCRKLKCFSRYRLTGNFLEIGCNSGTLLNIVREIGWTVKRVGICTAPTNHAREQLGLDVYTSTVEQAKYPENYFDVI